MTRKWRGLIRVAFGLVFLMNAVTIPVLAAGVVEITITATPYVTRGITGFTITYVSDTRLDMTWGYNGADRVMIRGKYSEYPDDIPDENTTPTDGYLAYYGNGTSTSDTSMNFDENAGILYYKIWGQKADGTWYTSRGSGWKEAAWVTAITALLAVYLPALTAWLPVITTLLTVALLNALAFKQSSIFLYALMTPVNIAFGLYYAGAAAQRYDWIIGVTIAIIGLFCLFRAVMMGISREKSNRRAE